MERRRRKLFVAITGLAALVVVGAVLLNSEKLLVAYYARRLTRDPGYFWKLIDEERNRWAKRALEEFVGTDQGAESFVRALLEERFGELLSRWAESSSAPDRKCLVHFKERNGWLETRSGEPGSWTGEFDARGRAKRRVLASILSHVSKKPLRLREYPGLTFCLLDQEEAQEAVFGIRRRVKSFADWMFVVTYPGPHGPYGRPSDSD